MLPLGLAVCLSLFGDLSLFAALATRLDTVGLGVEQMGILLSIHRLVRLPANLVVGYLMDRVGRRPLFLLGMVLAVLSSAAYGLVYGFWPFLFSRVAWGFAWALINVGGMSMVLDASTPENRGHWSGLYNIWMWAGYAAGPLIGGVLVDVIQFRPAMLVCAAFSAIGLAVALLRLPETLPPARRHAATIDVGQRLAGLWQHARTLVLHNPAARTTMALFSLNLFVGDGILLATLTLLLTQRLSDQLSIGVASASGMLLALRSLAAAFCGQMGGRLSDGRGGRRPVILASLVLSAASMALLAYATSLPLMVIAILAGAAGAGTAISTLAAAMGDALPAGQQGAGMGVYSTAGDVGSSLGPLLALSLSPRVGLQSIYLAGALLLLLGAAFQLRVRPAVKAQGNTIS